MSELGNETTTAAFKLSEKALDALLQFIKFLMERQERKINTELKKAQLEDVQLKRSEQAAQLKVQGKVGYVKSRLLHETGEPLVGINISLNDTQMKDFAKYAKKFGLLYTSFSDKTQTGEKVHTFLIREKDLAIAKSITERMTEDLHLSEIKKERNKIIEKGEENLTEKDLKDLESLDKEVKNIYKRGTDVLNEEHAEEIFKDICGEMKDKVTSFDRALNRITDRDFSRDTSYFICERTDPQKYIELISERDTFRDKEYTKTNYKVFNEGEQKLNVTDERFEGRPKNFWNDLKNKMKEQGGFSDDIVVFNTKQEFDRYQELYMNSIIHDAIIEVKNGEYKDYMSIIEQLKDQLPKSVELSARGIPIDKNTKERLDILKATTNEEKSNIAECYVIAKQIVNYTAINEAQVMLAMDKSRLETISQEIKGIPNTAPNYTSLANEQLILFLKTHDEQNNLNSLLEKENELNNERKMLSGVEATNEVAKEIEMDKGAFENFENKEQEESVLDNIGDIRRAIGNIFQVDERNNHDERAELDRNTLSMDDWRGQMNEQRQNIQRENPIRDKNLETGNVSKNNRNNKTDRE